MKRLCLCYLLLSILSVVPTWAATEIEMVKVRGGCYQMGDGGVGRPEHEVCVSDFYLGKYEVTQTQWQAVMGKNPSWYPGKTRPVETVSWNDVQQFIVKLRAQTGRNYRLPTEAEWEYAARSGGKTEKWSGTNDQTRIDDYAWFFNDNNRSGKTHEVGKKQPNSLGLYDMSGNVWEWCADWYNDIYYLESPRNNPSGPTTGEYRILRGGGRNNFANDVPATERFFNPPDNTSEGDGFRLALSSQ